MSDGTSICTNWMYLIGGLTKLDIAFELANDLGAVFINSRNDNTLHNVICHQPRPRHGRHIYLQTLLTSKLVHGELDGVSVHLINQTPDSLRLERLKHLLKDSTAIRMTRECFDVLEKGIGDEIGTVVECDQALPSVMSIYLTRFSGGGTRTHLHDVIGITPLDTIDDMASELFDELVALIPQHMLESFLDHLGISHVSSLYLTQTDTYHSPCNRTSATRAARRFLPFWSPTLPFPADCTPQTTFESHSSQRHRSSTHKCWARSLQGSIFDFHPLDFRVSAG